MSERATSFDVIRSALRLLANRDDGVSDYVAAGALDCLKNLETEYQHSCPVCRCKWTPSGPYTEGKTQSEAIFNNVQRMAREIRMLNQALARARQK